MKSNKKWRAGSELSVIHGTCFQNYFNKLQAILIESMPHMSQHGEDMNFKKSTRMTAFSYFVFAILVLEAGVIMKVFFSALFFFIYSKMREFKSTCFH